MNPSSRDLLVSAQRSAFNIATRYDRLTLFSPVLLTGLAILSAVLPLPNATILFLAASLAGSALSFISALCTHNARLPAEAIRRATLLSDGLGLPLSPQDFARLLQPLPHDSATLAPWNDSQYYASLDPPGLPRALANLHESAFWSFHLFQLSASLTFRLLVLLAILLIAAPILIFTRVPPPALAALLSCVLAIISWSLLAHRLWCYRRAVALLRPFLARIAQLRHATPSNTDFLLLLLDYNAIVEAAPMVVPGVFVRNHDRLDRLWGEANHDRSARQ